MGHIGMSIDCQELLQKNLDQQQQGHKPQILSSPHYQQGTNNPEHKSPSQTSSTPIRWGAIKIPTGAYLTYKVQYVGRTKGTILGCFQGHYTNTNQAIKNTDRTPGVTPNAYIYRIQGDAIGGTTYCPDHAQGHQD